MGEPRKIEVGLVDLKVLVKSMLEKDVYERARRLVESQYPADADQAGQFAQLVSEAKPEAQKAVEPRYRRLLEALESGTDVAQSLAAFLHRGH
jgi:hypothetical protein